MRKTLPIIIVASIACFAATRADAQSFLQTFDAGSGGTFLTDFTQSGPNAPNFFQNTVGGGINNTNAVDLTSNTGDATAIYRNATFDLSATPTITISGYFRNQQIGGGGAAGPFRSAWEAMRGMARPIPAPLSMAHSTARGAMRCKTS